MKRYAVLTKDGLALDKDGHSPLPPDQISLEEASDYLFKSRIEARDFVEWQDPGGVAGLQVKSLDVTFTIE